MPNFVDVMRYRLCLNCLISSPLLAVQRAKTYLKTKQRKIFLTVFEDRSNYTLCGNDPVAIIEKLPGLINGVKMIHTIARYFGTNERVTKLFMKITIQIITSCKQCINGKDHSDKVWDKDLPSLLE